MKRFKFNLESVLTIRKKKMEDEHIKLASITNVYNKQNEVLEQMLNELQRLETESQQCVERNFDVQQLAMYGQYSFKLSQDILTQKKIIEKTEKELINQQNITKDAYIKVKSLENLKDKKKEDYIKETLQEEFKTIDDIVTSRQRYA